MSEPLSTAFKVVIPARIGSSRLAGKVLADLHGKPVLRYVWEAAQRSGAEQVVVATDDEAVLRVAQDFGAQAMLTSASHPSGTDRVNEVARRLGWDARSIVVNLQGDEPLMPPALIRQAAELLASDPAADIGTLCHPIQSLEDWLNPNVVKVVCDRRGYALYFSRAPIPWQRDGASREAPRLPNGLAFRHIGLYAYRADRLLELSALPASGLEQCEALEQLRALTHGLRIRLGVSESAPARGIDTAEDLLAVSALLAMR